MSGHDLVSTQGGQTLGHQYFERLAGKWAGVLKIEMSKDVLDLEGVLHVGSKLAHNRVLQLFASGDLRRVRDALNAAVAESCSGSHPVGMGVALARAVEGLGGCTYPDEARRVALLLPSSAGNVRQFQMEDVLRAASWMGAKQVCHAEALMRLPRDGLLSTQILLEDLGHRISARVGENLVEHWRQNPRGWRDNKWKAPRAGAHKVSSEALGNGFDMA
jgi:hypothetical protein